MSEYNFQLKDHTTVPSGKILENTLGNSYEAYEEFQEEIARLEMEQTWQWYKQYKAWFARGQHFWTTSKGTRKEKTVYWLYVYEGWASLPHFRLLSTLRPLILLRIFIHYWIVRKKWSNNSYLCYMTHSVIYIVIFYKSKEANMSHAIFYCVFELRKGFLCKIICRLLKS